MPLHELTDEKVADYLRSHPTFLEKFVIDEIEVEQLERWIIRRSQRMKMKPNDPPYNNGRKTSLSRWKFCVHADKRQMLLNLTQNLQLNPTKDHVLWELGNCISSAVGADGFRLYLPDRVHTEELSRCSVSGSNQVHCEPKFEHVRLGSAIASHVAKCHESVRYSKGEVDPRFPGGIPDEEEICHVLCQPLTQPDGQLAAVLELWRGEKGNPFHEEDEEIVVSYLVWGGIALHYAHLCLNMIQQRKLNDFLLDVVKSIFQDMVSMDQLVFKIMDFAQKLVDADRASLFLVDSKNKELYATVFDIGDPNITNDSNKSYEIRFPLGTGIAGQVAETGEILNICDAYSDGRFNRTVDQLTGYKTNTILCMPIFIRNSVIGVVQMVNKHKGLFTKDDEEAFRMFAIYCGLALHHAKLYDQIKRSEQKYKVALEVLSYHNTCNQEEFKKALTDGIPSDIIGIDDYYFDAFAIEDYEKAKAAMYMFVDLFGLSKFDTNSLIKFTFTVRKNYRRVPYHNFTHGFSVANAMYCIIKNCGKAFQLNECLALYISSLCHDLDHRGKNNKFMLDTESPLANMYSTSILENHHFNQTVTILQQEDHNIFCKLSDRDFKQILSLIKHCILATDLALFFPNKTRLTALIENDQFEWDNFEHRLLLQAISMTAADLSASAKPWDVQFKTVEVIFEEFYQQGDAEKEAGRIPIPMMDRDRCDEQAASQVGFLKGICIPCYTLLYKLIPQTKPMLDMCNENLVRWEQIDKEVKSQKNALESA